MYLSREPWVYIVFIQRKFRQINYLYLNTIYVGFLLIFLLFYETQL